MPLIVRSIWEGGDRRTYIPPPHGAPGGGRCSGWGRRQQPLPELAGRSVVRVRGRHEASDGLPQLSNPTQAGRLRGRRRRALVCRLSWRPDWSLDVRCFHLFCLCGWGVYGRWQVMDFARLNHSTVSFFDHMKQETPVSRWNRVRLNASKARYSSCFLSFFSSLLFKYFGNKQIKTNSLVDWSRVGIFGELQVGQGSSKDAKALELAFQHWIEAVSTHVSFACGFLTVLDLLQVYTSSQKVSLFLD